jgi:hypothetical protein
MDWDAVLLVPLYASLGVPATLTVATLTALVPVTALDDTKGIEITQGKSGLLTIKPVCSLRMRELATFGLVPSNLIGGTISLRPGTPDQADWHIESHLPKPNPSGETAGETQLILTKAPS